MNLKEAMLIQEKVFELSADKKTVEIHFNKAGLEILNRYLEIASHYEDCDHDHLMSDFLGPGDISSKTKEASNSIIHMATLHVFPKDDIDKKFLTFELNKNSDDVLDIHFNKNGLELLSSLVGKFTTAKDDKHVKLRSDALGGKELTSENMQDDSRLIHKVSMYYWPRLKIFPEHTTEEMLAGLSRLGWSQSKRSYEIIWLKKFSDRVLKISPQFRDLGDKYKLCIEASITTVKFFDLCVIIGDDKKENFEGVNLRYDLISDYRYDTDFHYSEFTFDYIKKVDQALTNWTLGQSLYATYKELMRPKLSLSIPHLAALALDGRWDQLKSYKTNFAKLKSHREFKKLYLPRAIELAKQYNPPTKPKLIIWLAKLFC